MLKLWYWVWLRVIDLMGLDLSCQSSLIRLVTIWTQACGWNVKSRCWINWATKTRDCSQNIQPRLVWRSSSINFFTLLERGLSSSEAIPNDVMVREEYGIRRSIRRDTTSHVLNQEIPDECIEQINRWRKDPRGISSDMIDLYTSIEAI